MAKTDETRLDQTTVSTDKTTNAASQQSDMPVLRLDDVSYSYTKGGKRVLKNISHDFQSGNVHAITGPSGAGKTTMLSGKTFDRSKKEIVNDLLVQVHLPQEYANERILHLSGGEQQRVAIARALSHDPAIIVADEPTGNLDLATQDDIMGIFQALAHDEQHCVIIVTHSPEVAKASDEIFELAPIKRRR